MSNATPEPIAFATPDGFLLPRTVGYVPAGYKPKQLRPLFNAVEVEISNNLFAKSRENNAKLDAYEQEQAAREAAESRAAESKSRTGKSIKEAAVEAITKP